MIAALIKKELRETIPWGLAGLFFGLGVFATRLGVNFVPWDTSPISGDVYIPFVAKQTTESFVIVAALLAVALGLRQSIWEEVTRTYLFLLHRPVDRRLVFAVKMAVGVVVLSVAAWIPVLVYAFWAATPGTHASPFQWNFLGKVAVELCLVALIYVGAFLSGLRPGRWLGTKLWPLVGVVFLWMISQALPAFAWAAVFAVGLWLLVDLVMFICTTRDYS